MTPEEENELQETLKLLRRGIREIAHDISNPLGVLRMAAYYLQNGKPEKEKQEHYYNVITQTVDKVEAGLNKLRELSENPKLDVRGNASEDKTHE
jgi:nitrogen-specific signal transduction histidine kinase